MMPCRHERRAYQGKGAYGHSHWEPGQVVLLLSLRLGSPGLNVCYYNIKYMKACLWHFKIKAFNPQYRTEILKDIRLLKKHH